MNETAGQKASAMIMSCILIFLLRFIDHFRMIKKTEKAPLSRKHNLDAGRGTRLISSNVTSVNPPSCLVAHLSEVVTDGDG
jgi:hypothetical protein